MIHTVKLKNGTAVPALGQGTWYLGERPGRREEEIRCLKRGAECGMTVIDTAEMYGDGAAERLIGACGFDYSSIFIISKVYPFNAGRSNIFTSCENSLKRMKTDCIDLYLLHWRGAVPLSETVACMEELKKQGKIRSWGVSNFDIDDMEELWSVPDGSNCVCNEVLYHLGSRGIEYSLSGWMKQHGVANIAYCPLAQGGTLRRGLFSSPAVKQVAAKHGADVSQIVLAWCLGNDNTIAIPRTGQLKHLELNASAADIVLDAEDVAALNQAFPAPDRKTMLDMQ